MSDEKADMGGWAKESCNVLASNCQLGPVNLDMPDDGLNMPDVHLDMLCDIIFANIDSKIRNSKECIALMPQY